MDVTSIFAREMDELVFGTLSSKFIEAVIYDQHSAKIDIKRSLLGIQKLAQEAAPNDLETMNLNVRKFLTGLGWSITEVSAVWLWESHITLMRLLFLACRSKLRPNGPHHLPVYITNIYRAIRLDSKNTSPDYYKTKHLKIVNECQDLLGYYNAEAKLL